MGYPLLGHRPNLAIVKSELLSQVSKLMRESEVAARSVKLWCVELIPVRGELSEKELLWFAKGAPSEPNGAVLWAARALNGFADHRVPVFLREGQRLVIFTDKAQAAACAKEETNEFWVGKVREARIR